jgi:hypothetical protein
MADLTNEHITMVHRRFTSELNRYEEEMEKAELELGRQLTFRERRRICIERDLTHWKRVSSYISGFNLAARLCEEIDGLTVTARLPRLKRTNVRGTGSADPSKVLSPEQIAELERALSRDLRRYDRACARIQKELGHLDLRRDEWKTRYSGFDVVRYFGINGHREHTAKELSELRGRGPKSAPEIPR